MEEWHGQKGSMTMAMNESVKEGKEIKVRVLGEHAYPEDIRPLAKPPWLKFILIGLAFFGNLLIAGGVFRLLLIGGVLAGTFFVARKSMAKENETPPPLPPEL